MRRSPSRPEASSEPQLSVSTHSLMRYHRPSAERRMAKWRTNPSSGSFLSSSSSRCRRAATSAFTPERGVKRRIMTCSSVRSRMARQRNVE